MGVGRIFTRRGQLWVFPGLAKKIFQERTKSDEISFYPLEIKKSTSFAKYLIGNCRISKSRGILTPPFPPNRKMSYFKIKGDLDPSLPPFPMNIGHYLWDVERVKRLVKCPFALHRQQFEKDKQSVDVATPGKISADAHVLRNTKNITRVLK